MEAIIYARFSTLEQRKGDSLRRQLDDCRAFCHRKGWPVVGELIDQGRSAFKGANRAEGSELGGFEREAAQGYHRGKVLVVEKLDRISRRGAEDAIVFLTTIMKNGVSVATAEGDEVYQAGEKLSLERLMRMMWKMEGAHEESAKKAERLAKVWTEKRKAAVEKGKAMTSQAPAWLSIDTATGRFIEDPAVWSKGMTKGDVVRHIFQRAQDGVGTHSIAKELNAADVASFGSGKSGWRHTYIRLILESRAVIGERQHHRNLSEGGSEPVGDAQRDYYPRVVDLSLFENVQSARADRRGNRGRKGRTFTNLLTGIVQCESCLGIVTASSKTRAGTTRMKRGKLVTVGTDSIYLLCDNVKRGRCENRARVNYIRLEKVLLDKILHLALDDTHFARPDVTFGLEERAAEIRMEIDDLKSRRARILDAIESGDDDEQMRERRRTLGEKIDESSKLLKDAERELVRARGAVAPDEHLRRVHNVRAAIDDPDEAVRLDARRKVHQALKGVIDFGVLHRDKSIHFVLGGLTAVIWINGQGVVTEVNDGGIKALAAGEIPHHIYPFASPELQQRARAIAARYKREGVGLKADTCP